MDILIGTHRILQKDVSFKDLGLLIIDEEHRFGVKQKEAIKKFRTLVDVLALTATPIPRTLTHTLYGDLENIVLKDMPPGRKPIRTRLVPFEKRGDMYEFLLREIKTGNRVYWVVPRIAGDAYETATMDDAEAFRQELQSMQALAVELRRYASSWRVKLCMASCRSRRRNPCSTGFNRAASTCWYPPL